jgi:hypothetical protein
MHARLFQLGAQHAHFDLEGHQLLPHAVHLLLAVMLILRQLQGAPKTCDIMHMLHEA